MSPLPEITQPIPMLRPHPQLMPAEWGPHEATWLAWPHNTRDWPGKFAPIPWVYAEIVRNVARGETVRLLVQDAQHEAKVRRVLARAGVDLARVELRRVRTDRAWVRDSGPIFVRRLGKKAIARFRFDAWAKYPDWKNDAKLPERAAKALGVPLLPVERNGRPVVLEGGAIDVNGQGTLLATEECLLDPAVQVRNPGFGREDYEAVFAEALGATSVVWLGKGIAGDDTHGHVDDLTRFVNETTVVTIVEEDRNEANYPALAENLERLRKMKDQGGNALRVEMLPMPRPVYFNGQRLPASYANFYIANGLVIVPTFNDANDRVALNTLAGCFPGREVVGIHCRDLVLGLGTLHCMTHHETVRDSG